MIAGLLRQKDLIVTRAASHARPYWRLFAIWALVLFTKAAFAEIIEVAPGVKVTRKTFSGPINEQPFYGFAEKSAAMREADNRFISGIIQLTGSREKAFSATTLRGWRALGSGNFSEAARRFNEAFLLNPEASEVYHGLAALAQARFNDVEFAEELFQVARGQPNPAKNVNADYGRLLMIAKRPHDAQPVLEQAVIDNPEFGDAWANLAFARLQNGNVPAACVAANEAGRHITSPNSSYDLALFKRQAQCN